MGHHKLLKSGRRVGLSFAAAVLVALFSVISMTASASAAHLGSGPSDRTAAQVAHSSAAQVKSNCAKNQITKGVNGLCMETEFYSGYSAQLPSGVWPLGITGTWTVPKVSCPQGVAGALNDKPRTAVWVGQWGSMEDIFPAKGSTADAWLPQIGTASRCSFGKAIYSIAWEMATDQSQYGNAAQDTLACPGNKIYKLCAYASISYPKNPSDKMTINPGDRIRASVGIETGNQLEPSAKAAPRKFDIYLDDETTGVIADGYMVTAEGTKQVPVNLSKIIQQSGVVVEDEPGCDLSKPLCGGEGPTFNGLAKFTPIKITAWIAQWKPYKTTVNEWVLQRDYLSIIHRQLAQNSAPSGSMDSADGNGMSWTVTWLHQY